jgi:hypothetical protein
MTQALPLLPTVDIRRVLPAIRLGSGGFTDATRSTQVSTPMDQTLTMAC